MFKYLLIWFLVNYSYENMNDTYKSYKHENPIKEMSDFIQHQQYREDQLRKQCNLQFYKIDPQRTPYDDIYDYIKEILLFPKLLLVDKSYKSLIHKLNYKQVVYMDKLVAETFESFMNLSHNSVNIGREIEFEGVNYILLQNGIKDTNIYNYANQMHTPLPRKPEWTIKLGNLSLTVTDIKNSNSI